VKPLAIDYRIGDCIEVLKEFPENHFDACVTDGPYDLGFMGKTWDSTGVTFQKATWEIVLRTLKPGAHLLAFGGTRTHHRLTCALEDAGFEIRDCLMWLYGSGFPKSLDVSKAIDKARTEDEEPVRAVCRFVRARMGELGLVSKDLTAVFGHCNPRLIDHWAARDTDSQPTLPTPEQWDRLRAALSLDTEMDAEVQRLNARKGTRGDAWRNAEVVGEHVGEAPGLVGKRFSTEDRSLREATDAAARWQGWGTALKPAWEPIILARKPLQGTVAENVLKWGTGGLNVDGCRIGTQVETWPRTRSKPEGGGGIHYNESVPSKTVETGASPPGRWPANLILDEESAALLDEQSGESEERARTVTRNVRSSEEWGFNRKESDTWQTYADAGGASRFFYTAKAGRDEREEGIPGRVLKPRHGRQGAARANFHPTVKPLDLMRYLVRLVTPPGGLVLDPFLGSGTTLLACRLEGFSGFGIEKGAEYEKIIQGRLASVPPPIEGWGQAV
jgi:DNA modification methylase